MDCGISTTFSKISEVALAELNVGLRHDWRQKQLERIDAHIKRLEDQSAIGPASKRPGLGVASCVFVAFRGAAARNRAPPPTPVELRGFNQEPFGSSIEDRNRSAIGEEAAINVGECCDVRWRAFARGVGNVHSVEDLAEKGLELLAVFAPEVRDCLDEHVLAETASIFRKHAEQDARQELVESVPLLCSCPVRIALLDFVMEFGKSACRLDVGGVLSNRLGSAIGTCRHRHGLQVWHNVSCDISSDQRRLVTWSRVKPETADDRSRSWP